MDYRQSLKCIIPNFLTENISPLNKYLETINYITKFLN
jgi:hypothetical protein